MIEGLLQISQDKRLTLQQLLAHPWYLGELPSQQELQKEMGYRFKKLNIIVRQERDIYIKAKMAKKGRKTQEYLESVE